MCDIFPLDNNKNIIKLIPVRNCAVTFEHASFDEKNDENIKCDHVITSAVNAWLSIQILLVVHNQKLMIVKGFEAYILALTIQTRFF